MQAVIRSGSKQYLVSPGQTLEIDRLTSDAKNLTFAPLLVIDGDNIQVGTPEISGVAVKADVLEEVKGEKIKILKFRAKKREKTLTGHRQRYTRIQITAIGDAKAERKAEKKPAKAAA